MTTRGNTSLTFSEKFTTVMNVGPSNMATTTYNIEYKITVKLDVLTFVMVNKTKPFEVIVHEKTDKKLVSVAL